MKIYNIQSKKFLFLLIKNLLKKYSFLTYFVVGCFAALIYLISFGLLWQCLGLNYKVSVSITYFLTVFFHFTANRRFTFRAHGTDFFNHAFKYACMIIINYFITLAIMHLMVEAFHLSPYFGVIISIITNFNTNFLIARYWVFQEAKSH